MVAATGSGWVGRGRRGLRRAAEAGSLHRRGEMDRLRGLARRQEPVVPGGLRLITFNLQGGQPAAGWTDEAQAGGIRGACARQQQVLDELVQVSAQLAALRPDLLLLQEVDKSQRRSGYLNQAEILAYGVGLPYWRFAAAFAGPIIGLHRTPRDSSIPNTKGFGVVVASRWPVRAWKVKRLGRARLRLGWKGKTWQGMQMGLIAGMRDLVASKLKVEFGQTRVLLAAHVMSPFGSLAVGCTHLETSRAVATGQVRRAWRSIVDMHAPNSLLGGDFNLSPQQVAASLEMLGEDTGPQLHAAATSFPAWRPQHDIDQLLGKGWVLVAAPQTLRLGVSVHLAVVFDVVPAGVPGSGDGTS